MTALATSTELFTALRERRSIYGLSKESTISDERVQEIVSETLIYTPSGFNAQSTRIVLLLGEQHNKLWDITTEVLRSIVPANRFSETQQKMNTFRNAHGTILFFEDQGVIEGLQKQFPSYHDKFPQWSDHTNAMHQIIIWMALEAEGLGANLQHYNPIIDEKVTSEWDLPKTWRLVAQMVFGSPTAPAGEKQFNAVSERFRIFE